MVARFIAWLKSWFVRSTDIYHADERLIFKFFNGVRWVHGDPLVLYRRLMDVAPVLSVDIKVAQSELKAAPEAHKSVVKTTREIFGISAPNDEFDCAGTLSEAELQFLLDDFLAYANGEKKNTRRITTFAEVHLPTGNSSPVVSQPIKSSSDSGSTAAEASTNSLTPSPSAAELPSVP